MGDTQTSLAGDFSQADRLLAIETSLGPDQALLIDLDGEDVLSHCFIYRIVIATQQPDSAVQSLLGTPVTLWLLNNSTELRRPIHGHVRRVIGNGITTRGTRLYKLEVVPRLWFLTCTSDCRIFQDQSIPDILQTVFTEHGLTDFEFRIVREEYPRVEYCVQYQETAHDFVSRLMEHIGLFYWHEHSASGHHLVIADRNAATGRYEPADTVDVSPRSGYGELQTLQGDCSFRPGRWALNDYDFQSPTKLLRVDAPTTRNVPRMIDHEMYEYPGKFIEQDRGRWLTRRRIELEEAQQHLVFGTGRAAGFDPGRRFKVGAPRGEPEPTYLLTEVRHHGSDPGAETGGAEPSYSNDFVAIPFEAPFRPERLTRKPFVRGAQTATVVGPPGENIHCDMYGRVRVQFHWDRRGQRNDRSSCWIRVAQARAGSYYGSQVIPHVGHEVVVSFLEGDPDRPLIIGTVPNALTMPPLELPRRKDKTIQRDHGGNKIIMHGKSGLEHLSLASPRAINMVSAVGVAKPLSADVSFSGAPGQAAAVTVDGFKDPGALQQLQNTYNLLTGGDDANMNPDYQEGGNTGDYADAGSFNTVAEQNINSLSMCNTNAWVCGCSNAWVSQDSNSMVCGNTSSQVDGNSSSVVEGGSQSVVLGDNISFTLGASLTTVVGGTAALALGGNFALTIGANLSVTLGANQSISLPERFDYSGVDLRAVTTRVDNVVTNMENAGFALVARSVEMISTEARIAESGAYLLNADIVSVT
jgi:type VI secretion system secreted protein VgrG